MDDCTMAQQNLFAALRAAFPADLDQFAVETTASDGQTLLYSWRDLDRLPVQADRGDTCLAF